MSEFYSPSGGPALRSPRLDRARRRLHLGAPEAAPGTAVARLVVSLGTGTPPQSFARPFALGRKPPTLVCTPDLGLDDKVTLQAFFDGGGQASQSWALASLPQQGDPVLRVGQARLDRVRGEVHLTGLFSRPDDLGQVLLVAVDAQERARMVARAQTGQPRPGAVARNNFLPLACGWSIDAALGDDVLGDLLAGRVRLVLWATGQGGSDAPVLASTVLVDLDLAPDPGADRAAAVRRRARAKAEAAPDARLRWLLASEAFRRRWQEGPDSLGWILRDQVASAIARRLSSGDELAIRLSNGDLVLCQPIDDSILARRFLFQAGDEQGFLDWVSAQVRPGDTALDLGAAYGVVSRALARRGAHVVAVEADPLSAGRIRRSQLWFATGAGKPEGRITLIEAAVSDHIGEVVFAGMGGSVVGSGKIIDSADPDCVATFLSEVSALNQVPLSSLQRNGKERRRFGEPDVQVRRIPATTVDAICAEHQLRDVALMKIDIEGGELLALRGALGLLTGRFGKPPLVAFEYSALFPTRGGQREEILDIFLSRGWSLYRMAAGKNGGGALMPVADAASAPHHDNLVAVPPDRNPPGLP